jgi:hypothetical protein
MLASTRNDIVGMDGGRAGFHEFLFKPEFWPGESDCPEVKKYNNAAATDQFCAAPDVMEALNGKSPPFDC